MTCGLQVLPIKSECQHMMEIPLTPSQPYHDIHLRHVRSRTVFVWHVVHHKTVLGRITAYCCMRCTLQADGAMQWFFPHEQLSKGITNPGSCTSTCSSVQPWLFLAISTVKKVWCSSSSPVSPMPNPVPSQDATSHVIFSDKIHIGAGVSSGCTAYGMCAFLLAQVHTAFKQKDIVW